MIVPLRVLPGFLFYCYVSGITPGPANLCSLSTAMRYGRREALRQWLGLLAGFFVDSMSAVFIAFFLGTVLNEYVSLLSYVGAAYLVFLAVKMLGQTYSDEGGERRKKPGFLTGLFVNLTNVKVILFCINALASFVLPYNQAFWAVLLAGAFLPFTGPVCNLAWLFAGDFLRRFFSGHAKAVNWVMALSLLVCAASLILP